MSLRIGMETKLEGNKPYIVGRWYDGVFFIGAPILALGLGALVAETRWNLVPWNAHQGPNDDATIVSVLLGMFIHAHLALVFVRSHGNGQVRKAHPIRFFVVPPILLLAVLTSSWALVCVSVIATFWDVYHSALQTFGLGRIYETRAGNPPNQGRRLDYWLNLLLYAGPILAGATMLDHFEDFREFESIGFHGPSVIPLLMERHHTGLGQWLLLLGSVFLLFYIWSYYRLSRAGHAVSLPKVLLLVATGLCSIYTWGFNSFGEAFFIMNFFHALQYFALMWWKEGTKLKRRVGSLNSRLKAPAALCIFLVPAFAYGILVERAPSWLGWLYPLSLVISILHFWYDGFIWSVRHRAV